jgi:hypothetical protein
MTKPTVASPVPARAVVADEALQRSRARLEACVQAFRDRPVTPASAYALEQALRAIGEDLGRQVLEGEFNRLEPDDRQGLPARVRYCGETYRLNKKSGLQVGTSLGVITLRSFLYLCEEAGEPGLHPLWARLGICAGAATTVLAERVARWAVDFSQREVRRLLRAEHGLSWSNDRLRAALRAFRRAVATFQQAAQTQRLRDGLEQAERTRGRHRPVLAVGRDGIMVPLRGRGFQEASTATVSVYDRRGRRLVTVYLGQMPEPGQAALSARLTALLESVLKAWAGPTPRLAYITDRGHTPEDYYRRVLRRMPDPRRPERRLRWERVLDFYHVCGYLSQLREALFGAKGQGWFGRMRHWLRHRARGVANLLRSAVQQYNRRRLSAAARRAFWKAYRYLRRHRRYLDYPAYQRQGLPLGSGVTEAACKTVFTQRLKRSGMRWHKDSGQVIVDLRVLCLSGVWATVVRQDLDSRPLPEEASSHRSQRKTRPFAA